MAGADGAIASMFIRRSRHQRRYHLAATGSLSLRMFYMQYSHVKRSFINFGKVSYKIET